MNFRMTFICVILSFTLLPCFAIMVNAAILHSSAFPYKYEMDVNPESQDLDSNGGGDWDQDHGGNPASTFDGMMTATSTGYNPYNFVLNQAGYSPATSWPGTVSFESGWTVEFSMVIIDDQSPEDSRPAFQNVIQATGADGMINLGIRESQVQWNNLADEPQGSVTVLSTADNTDGFHIFRIAQEPGQEAFSVWRDGVLLSDSLGYTADIFTRNDWGTFGWLINTWQVDYYRYTSGAYEPPVLTIRPGDADQNGIVDEDDAATVAGNWMMSEAAWSDGDFNDDGVVDDIDATMMATNWYVVTQTNSAVPELGVFILLATGSLAAVVCVWRSRHRLVDN